VQDEPEKSPAKPEDPAVPLAMSIKEKLILAMEEVQRQVSNLE